MLRPEQPNRRGSRLSASAAASGLVLRHGCPTLGCVSRRSSCCFREGLGRPPQAEDAAAPRLPVSAAAVTRMNWEELQILAAAVYAHEIAAVEAGEGLEFLREQLGHMRKETRRVLRAALADPPS